MIKAVMGYTDKIQHKGEEIFLSTKTLEAAKEELTTGSTFVGRYKIIEELGKSGMSRSKRQA